MPKHFTHYVSSSKGSVEIESMHAAHIDQAVAKIRREGGDMDLAGHMETVATRKHREFLATAEGAEWAALERNHEKAAALRARVG